MNHGIKGYKDCRDSNLLWTIWIEEELERTDETGPGMFDREGVELSLLVQRRVRLGLRLVSAFWGCHWRFGVDAYGHVL